MPRTVSRIFSSSSTTNTRVRHGRPGIIIVWPNGILRLGFGGQRKMRETSCFPARLGDQGHKSAVALHQAQYVTNPSPVPLPTSFVVKKGLKILSAISGVMPMPVSVTLRSA